jgi:hypothetical protein
MRQSILRTNRKEANNSSYKKLAVHRLNKALCFVSSSVVADSLELLNRQLLVAAFQDQNQVYYSKMIYSAKTGINNCKIRNKIK